MKLNETQFTNIIKSLTEIGISLSLEKNHDLLLEKILLLAKKLTHADGGTIYTCTDDQKLKFEIMHTDSLQIHIGGSSTNQKYFPDLSLYDEFQKPNKRVLACWAAITHKSINITNAYTNKRFDLSGTKDFDKKTGYHSQSILTLPLTNHLNEVIGVLQLINAQDKKTKQIIPFSRLNQNLAESLASQAAVILSNRELIVAQKKLFDSLIQLIAKAIDEKSPYTGSHCKRVPVITNMLAKAACAIDKGPLKDFRMNEDEFYELEVAAWLHDCGKISTPESIVDKATKLEGIFDSIHLIDSRFEIIKRDLIIESLQQKLLQKTGEHYDVLEDQNIVASLKQLEKERELIRVCNIGGEQLQAEQVQDIERIAQKKWISLDQQVESLLSSAEVDLLKISQGTLSAHERNIINNHVKVSIKMLESLPYPKNLSQVPLLAGCHHEKMDGSGYPRGLSREQIPVAARIIAIADIFEALTAGDRPYKKAMSLSQSLQILGQMKLSGKIDPDLFDVFINSKIYQQYADEYLHGQHNEIINVEAIPGYKQI